MAWFGKDKAESDISAAPTADMLLAELNQIERLVEDASVCTAIQYRVQLVCEGVRNTLPRIDTLGWSSADAYAIVATVTDYLPEALDGYLKLPRQWADTRPLESGKSALLLLIDQLDLLALTLHKVFDAVNQRDAQALITHGRFLQEKFGISKPVVAEMVEDNLSPSSNPLDL